MLTVDTITDSQIRELRAATEAAEIRGPDDYVTIDVCDLALKPDSTRLIKTADVERTMTTREARARCAAILNACDGR